MLKKTFTVADNEIISRMIERMKKLVNSHSVQRAFCSNFNDVNEVMNLVELRVVREFNLPDTYASVLQVIHVYNFSWLSSSVGDQKPMANGFCLLFYIMNREGAA